MSDNDPKALLSQVENPDVREQLTSLYNELSGSSLRQQVTTLQDKVRDYEAKERQRTYQDAGIPESAYDVLDKVYDGDLDPEAVRTFAQSKGFAIGETTTSAPDPAAARAAGEDRLTQLNSGALPVRDPSINDQIAQAEANGEWDKVDRLNAQKLEAARRAS